MYNEKIEQLIKAALADGVLTEKERQILFKNAQAQGIDLDEFEMVLDARLAELQKAEKSAPKSNKFGDIRKCPACGAIVAAGSASCVECGYAFNEDAGTTAMDKLFERIEAIEKQYAAKKYDELEDAITGGRLKDKLEMTNKKIQAIRMFNVPNTRAELLGLLTSIEPLANPNGPKNGLRRNYTLEDLSLAYWDLFVNCINKSKISFAKDPSFAPYFEAYERKISEAKKSKSRKMKIIFGSIGAFVLLIVVLIIVGSSSSSDATEDVIQQNIEKAPVSNELRIAFEEYIAEEDADNAKATLRKMGTECYDEALDLIKLYIENGDVDNAIYVYEKLTPNHCSTYEMKYDSLYGHGSNDDYEQNATKLIRKELIAYGRYDEAWEYSAREYDSENYYGNAEDYFRFMSDVVIALCKENEKQEARTFVKEYSIWFVSNVDQHKKEEEYKNYNSSTVKSKLTEIINNY